MLTPSFKSMSTWAETLWELPLLISHKSFDTGIPYVTLEQLRLDKRSEAREARDPIILRKDDDRSFVDQQLEMVRAWLDQTVAKDANTDAEPSTLILEPSNSYLRAALYQHLEQEFGRSDFFVEHLVSFQSSSSRCIDSTPNRSIWSYCWVCSEKRVDFVGRGQ